MSLLLREKVFDDIVIGGVDRFTPSELNEFLSEADQLSIQAVSDQCVADPINDPQFSVRVEVSSDEVNWEPKNTTAEIHNSPLSTTNQLSVMGTDDGTVPGQGFARLRITVAGADSVHLCIYASGRAR
jgi:hypothetical protein